MRASRLLQSSTIWLSCSVVSADARSAILAAAERIIQLGRQFGIGDRAGLNAAAGGDADVAFGGGEARIGGERTRKGAGKRQSAIARLGMRVKRQEAG